MQRLHLKCAICRDLRMARGPLKKPLSKQENGITDARKQISLKSSICLLAGGSGKGSLNMDKKVFGCFLLGVSAGIGIGMLVALQPGEEIRGRLKAKADEITEHLRECRAALRNSLVSKVKLSSTERRLDQEALQRMEGEGGPDEAVVMNSGAG